MTRVSDRDIFVSAPARVSPVSPLAGASADLAHGLQPLQAMAPTPSLLADPSLVVLSAEDPDALAVLGDPLRLRRVRGPLVAWEAVCARAGRREALLTVDPEDGAALVEIGPTFERVYGPSVGIREAIADAILSSEGPSSQRLTAPEVLREAARLDAWRLRDAASDPFASAHHVDALDA